MTRLALSFALLAGVGAALAAPLSDPFRPPRDDYAGEAASTAGTPRLESILIAPDRRIAIIGGAQYTEGERYGDGRIVRITQTEVVIRRDGRDDSLKLLPQAGKRPSAAPQGK
ncbi:MAG: hypothetical protein ABR570_10515 [Burkholderiales bacterium]